MALQSVLSNDWSGLSALIDEALALAPEHREAWLEALADDRATHRDTLRRLLATQAEIETGDFLLQMPCVPEAEAVSAPASPHAPPAAGDRVGAYRLIEPIGQGGMGTVWLAERADGLARRRVALKLPHAVWGDAFTQRLVREREILAALEHPHIARLYDAGVDAQGRPFLAMAYVAGQPIDVHCRERSLGVRARIELLLQVMAAVAHAHARLVVHRDLKPGNILVGDDGQAVLLDFGIAKLLDGERTRDTALTALSGRALTLDYSSPEQIRGEPLGTGSDIYSMAVVAYELLAGGRPYRLKRGSAAELEEAIAAIESPRASDTTADARVARALRGDLDAILNKALKKAPDERYPTMAAFADDLRRFLAAEPVDARPDGIGYRLTKYVQRHRLQVVAGTLVAGALVAGTSVALWQAREARRSAAQAQAQAQRAQTEAATAKAVQGFIESVFTANSRDQPDAAAARATTARELLDRGVERIDKELATAPEAQLRLYDLLAQMYMGMGLNERGLDLERRSLALASRRHGEASSAALSAAANVGQTLDDLGRHDEALATLLKADVAAQGRADDRDAARLVIDTGLSHIYFNSDLPKGLDRARRAVAVARTLGPSADGVAALFALGEAARKSGHLEEARQALVDATAWIDLLGVGGELPNVLSSLGEVQDELGQLAEARATMDRAIDLAARSGDPHTLHISRYKLARYQYENRLLHDALASAGAEAAWVRSLGRTRDYGDLLTVVMVNYGRTLVAYGDAAQGLAVLDEARALLPQQKADRLGPLFAARADALIALGRLPEAAADLERATTMTAGGGPRITAAVRAVQRRYWVAAGRPMDALDDFLANAPKADATQNVYVALRRSAEEAVLRLAAGQDAAARQAATDALARIDRLPDRRFTRDAQAQATSVLGRALLHEGRVTEALPALQDALALHLAEYDPARSPATAKVRAALAEAQRRAQR